MELQQQRVILIIVIAVLLVSCGWMVFERLSNEPQAREEFAQNTIDELLDQIIESGLNNSPVDYNDPILTGGRTILITQEINEQLSREVCAKLVYLNKQNQKLPIVLLIKTTGGWQSDAFAIADLMQRIEAPVETLALGNCFSSGAMILAAGTGKRRALPNSLIMLHINEGKGDQKFSWEYQSRQRFESFWRRYARLPRRFFPMDKEEEYFFTPKQALDYGIIDEIVPEKPR